MRITRISNIFLFPSLDLKTLTNIRRYLITNKAYGDTGRRDDHLEMSGVHVGGRQGTLHFIRFPTSQVSIMKS